MTKEEIIDNIIYRQTDGEEYACLKKEDCMNAMQDYADQETERLKAELSELKEKLNNECDIYVAELTKLIERVKELGSELSELKERHKSNAVGFADFIALNGYTLIQKNISQNGAIFFINKNSIGVCSYEVYEQYYKQKFEK